MQLKSKKIFHLLFVALIVLLTGCTLNEKEPENLILKGESETWELTGYGLVISPELFKAGNGTLTMKGKDEYIADTIQFKTFAVIEGEDVTVHSSSASGDGINIAEQSTGAIEGDAYLNKNKKPITLDDISSIYMNVKWWDVGSSESKIERIELYSK